MSDVTTLKCWPSCTQAIDWSDDGIIALASHEHVELIFPNIQAQESNSEIPHWRHFSIQTPWFTREELEFLEPSVNKIYSIGEEISDSTTVALAWSPPGLGKHRRCALAVLTSNLVLSIWDSEGKPQDAKGWERRLIINDALESYFNAPENRTESFVASNHTDTLRLRRRIRHFTWAPDPPAQSTIGTRVSLARQFMAVSNDDNEIIVLAVDSPSTGSSDKWSVEVLGHFSVLQENEQVILKTHSFDDMMAQQRHAPYVAWSPWNESQEGLRSVLAYATNNDVRLQCVTYVDGAVHFGAALRYGGPQVRLAGPLTWSPRVDGPLRTLAVFVTHKVILLTVSALDASNTQPKVHNLDGRWDTISGVVWDIHDAEHPRIHFSSQISTTRYPTCTLELSDKEVKSISEDGWPYWREQIRGSQGHFSADNELQGNANAKVWGLSASPLGESIASGYTLHPTDMVEYGVAADRQTMVALTHTWGSDGDLIFPARPVSAENLFFTARKWIEKNVESTDDIPPVRKDILEKLVNTYSSPLDIPAPEPSEDSQTPAPPPVYDSEDLETLIAAFKRNAFLEENTLKDRLEILTTHICAPSDPTDIPRTLIAFRLAKATQHLPTSLSTSHPYSLSILSNHKKLIQLVEAVASSAPPETTSASSDPDPLPVISVPGDETCTFCEAAIPFIDPFHAVCGNGHEFLRCGLSFQAVQAPGCTKACGICNQVVMNDETVLEQEFGAGEEDQDDGDEDEDVVMGEGKERATDGEGNLKVTLARVLFSGCDVCIHCGGKYVG
ncbi:hypothetical protein M011DRAFT_471037 [Sporormia fimetaria CBS 119925]|uniref:Transcription factor IIIC 90kDa subunit N-terminal domain-containing protein n=1 Tax=Sporormia fimetaria CBS 119925 TaxID=1340428 RepID=A0A6A6V058_9PLEO|nr:hypothetical protein M011DRAFT_471037 [Sporormia fimetaria CBS 119925]